MRRLLLASAALLMLLPMSAKADTFTMDSFSQPNGAQNVTLTLGPLSRTVSAGEIDIHQNIPAKDLLVWCLDLNDTLTKPYTFTETTFGQGSIPHLPGLPSAGLDAGQMRQIASLMLKGLTVGGADAAQDDAATQLAIWSVEYGGGPGGVSFSGLSAPLAGRLALLLLDSANGGLIDCPTCTITLLTDEINAPNQALGFATQAVAVPGPIAGAGIPGVIAGGLFLLGLARRRKKLV